MKKQALSIPIPEKYHYIRTFFAEIANIFLFTWEVVKATFSGGFEFKEFARQCFQIGVKTLPLISITGIIMGLVLTIQSRPVLVDFGAVSLLPGMVAASLMREMGPVITGADKRSNYFAYLRR